MFEITAPIQSHAKCDVRSVVRFLNAKVNVQGKFTNNLLLFMVTLWSGKIVTKWCREFSERRTDVHDEERCCRPSLIFYDLLQEIEGEIRAYRRVTIRELHHIIPEVSKTTIHEAVTENLGYRKLCARWVPKMLMDDHKMKRMGSMLKFLTHYARKEMSFWTPLWLQMKHGFHTKLWIQTTVTAMAPYWFP